MSDWRCAHVYYYDDERRDELILDGIRPLLARIGPAVPAAFFLRHWRQGPHVRVCVLSCDEEFHRIVEPAVSEVVEGYLRTHPSRSIVDEASLLEAHERLAEREFERGPLRPLCPDNSIRYGPYDRRLHVLNSPQAADLLEDFYIDTNELVFDMLDRVRRGSNRLTIGLDLMLATAHAMWGDITRGFISYRAHAEGFIIQASDPDRLRSVWEANFRKQSTAITRRVHTVIAMLDGGQPPAPHVRTWVDALSPFQDRAGPLVRAGELRLTMGGEAGRANGWRQENLTHSDFQQQLYGNRSYTDFMRNDPRFQSYRLMLNLLYLHLHRLGIGAVERYYLCHLAADAVEAAMDVSALALVSR